MRNICIINYSIYDIVKITSGVVMVVIIW